MAAKSKSNTIDITRIYDAPVKLVWDAWTDPKQVAKWWGPRGFTITTHSKDLKPGGHWNYTMHGPDGVDYPNKTKYFEVEPMKKLVYDHGANDEQGPMFRVTVLFTEIAKNKTKMEMSMALPTPEAAAETRKFIKAAGGNSTWDRLAEYLEHESTGEDKFVINRSFEAPVATMYEMFTDPKHLAQWLGPTGSTMETISADIRVGGRMRYSMSFGDLTMYGSLTYRELHKPDRIAYTQDFRTKDDKISRHPMAPTWPETMLTVIELASEGPSETRVTITWSVVGEASPEERATFHKEKGGMTQGWTGSFDKLEEYLEKIQTH